MFANGNGCDGSQHFDNALLEDCIAPFQRSGDVQHLGEIVQLTRQPTETLIRHYHTSCYLSESELISNVKANH
jgi:hypothetical protein